MVLVSYDVKQNHVAMKDLLKSKGFKDEITGIYEASGEKSLSSLPNTTLWIDGNDAKGCRDIIKSAAIQTNALLEKCISVTFTHWNSI